MGTVGGDDILGSRTGRTGIFYAHFPIKSKQMLLRLGIGDIAKNPASVGMIDVAHPSYSEFKKSHFIY